MNSLIAQFSWLIFPTKSMSKLWAVTKRIFPQKVNLQNDICSSKIISSPTNYKVAMSILHFEDI